MRHESDSTLIACLSKDFLFSKVLIKAFVDTVKITFETNSDSLRRCSY